jgi:hypothetical protein
MCVSVGGWSGGVLQGVGMGVFADVSVFVYHICANAYMYYVHMQTYDTHEPMTHRDIR